MSPLEDRTAIDAWTGEEYRGPAEAIYAIPEGQGGGLFIRAGEIRGLRSSPYTFGAVVFGSKRIAVSNNVARPEQAEAGLYDGLLAEIVKFFQTGKPPVPASESLEILAFMEAADRGKLQRGAEAPLEPIQ